MSYEKPETPQTPSWDELAARSDGSRTVTGGLNKAEKIPSTTQPENKTVPENKVSNPTNSFTGSGYGNNPFAIYLSAAQAITSAVQGIVIGICDIGIKADDRCIVKNKEKKLHRKEKFQSLLNNNHLKILKYENYFDFREDFKSTKNGKRLWESYKLDRSWKIKMFQDEQIRQRTKLQEKYSEALDYYDISLYNDFQEYEKKTDIGDIIDNMLLSPGERKKIFNTKKLEKIKEKNDSKNPYKSTKNIENFKNKIKEFNELLKLLNVTPEHVYTNKIVFNMLHKFEGLDEDIKFYLFKEYQKKYKINSFPYEKMVKSGEKFSGKRLSNNDDDEKCSNATSSCLDKSDEYKDSELLNTVGDLNDSFSESDVSVSYSPNNQGIINSNSSFTKSDSKPPKNPPPPIPTKSNSATSSVKEKDAEFDNSSERSDCENADQEKKFQKTHSGVFKSNSTEHQQTPYVTSNGSIISALPNNINLHDQKKYSQDDKRLQIKY